MSRLAPEQQNGLPKNERLTFGIELEGLILPHKPARGFNFDNSEAISRLCQQLQLAKSSESYFSHDSRVYNRWQLGEDLTIRGVGNRQVEFELKSRILKDDQRSRQEIHKRLEALQKAGKVSTNRTCGFHVHVGMGYRGFSLRTLQNFCAIVAGFEHLLASLHPPHRQENEHCEGFDEWFFVSERGTVGNLTPGYQRVASILMTTGWDELKTLMTTKFTDYRGAYNICGAVTEQAFDPELRTIEFRQHRGTFSYSKIEAWVSACLSIVKYAYCATDAQLMQLFSNLSLPQCEFNAADLFEAMGFDDVASYYRSRLYPRVSETSQPLIHPAGQALVESALRYRPAVMEQVEQRRTAAHHKKIEAAVIISGCSLVTEQVSWLPFDELPYSLSHEQMTEFISEINESCSRKVESSEEGCASDGTDSGEVETGIPTRIC